MSIIFVVLGLGFLAGGAYAIVEGWPYLLIERGFTLVITGTVLTTAGVVMLALSRVMAELRRVRGQLSSAVMALSVASMANARDEREPVLAASPVAPESGKLVAGPAVIGGVLGAGAAAAQAMPVSPDEPAGDASRDDEPDLFAAPEQAGTPVAEAAEPRRPALWSEPESGIVTEPRADILPVATLDEFEAALVEATGEAKPGPAADEPFMSPEADRDIETAEVAPGEPMPAPSIDEDFDRLRDRLALGGDRAARHDTASDDTASDNAARDDEAWDRDAAPPLAGERRKASGSEIDAAADWMTPIRPGQDRWFGTLLSAAAPGPEIATEPEVSLNTAVEPPVWPPQTREAAPFALEEAPAEAGTDEPVAAMAEASQPDGEPRPLPSFALLPDPEPAFQPEPELDSARDESAEAELAPEPGFVEPPAPAASEEGVVGAYQVGTAHFTIYADGSIQARTPDGDYSFASMDELKVYLASEKSRLGV